MSRRGYVTTLLVGAWWGARLAWWLSDQRVRVARSIGYMEGGLNATKIHADVMREYGESVRGRRKRRGEQRP